MSDEKQNFERYRGWFVSTLILKPRGINDVWSEVGDLLIQERADAGGIKTPEIYYISGGRLLQHTDCL